MCAVGRRTAAIYTRFSRGDVAAPIEVQEQAIRMALAHRSILITGAYTDSTPPTKTAPRPGLRLLRQTVERREVSLVLVWSLDRIGLPLGDMVNFLSELDEAHVGLISVQEDIDTTRAHGRIILKAMTDLRDARARVRAERSRLYAYKARGPEVRGPGRPRFDLTGLEADAAVEVYGSARAAARALGCSHTLVNRRLKTYQAAGSGAAEATL